MAPPKRAIPLLTTAKTRITHNKLCARNCNVIHNKNLSHTEFPVVHRLKTHTVAQKHTAGGTRAAHITISELERREKRTEENLMTKKRRVLQCSTTRKSLVRWGKRMCPSLQRKDLHMATPLHGDNRAHRCRFVAALLPLDGHPSIRQGTLTDGRQGNPQTTSTISPKTP